MSKYDVHRGGGVMMMMMMMEAAVMTMMLAVPTYTHLDHHIVHCLTYDRLGGILDSDPCLYDTVHTD